MFAWRLPLASRVAARFTMLTSRCLDQPVKGDKRRTRSSSRFIIPDSSDNPDDLLETEPLNATIPPTHRVLKAVSIVSMAKKNTSLQQPPAVTTAHGDRDSSLGSPSLDNSEYETPGTSISTTPALSAHRSGKSARNSSIGTIMASGSAKRNKDTIADSDDDDVMDMDMSADAQLARQLQLEEDQYASTASKRRRIQVEDSEDELSSAPSEDEMAELQTYVGKGKGKAEDFPSQVTRSKRSKVGRIISAAEEDDIEDADSEEDEFVPDDGDAVFEDGDSDNGDSIINIVSDSNDDEPLMSMAKKRGTATPSSSKPARGSKEKPKGPVRKRGRGTSKRGKAQDILPDKSEFAHIEDKWERKRAMNRKRAEYNHPKLLTMWKDLAKIPVLDVQKADQPRSITRRLKPFQLEGLSWMIRQEKTDYKGGLLGDEMGTLLQRLRRTSANIFSGMGKTIQAVSLIMSDYPAKEPTLVVVPPVALMQWSNEIREYTDGKLKVLVYHGTNTKCKNMSVKDLRKFDVIMVSYNSLESLHRKETKGWSRGENIVKEASPLHAITYHRLILDEAHSIKSRTTGVAKACFALKGKYKWCLSGTPVQNRIGEFFSLLRFLEVRPFADYFCRSCDCEQLHWQVNEDHMCTKCDHGGSEHISVFNQELLNPITGDDPYVREQALEKLHMITARIMLRRMKRDHTNSMELPMKDIIIHNEFFSEFERDFSSSIMTNSSRKFDTYVAQGVMLNK
jgi:DNA repair protein RAD16